MATISLAHDPTDHYDIATLCCFLALVRFTVNLNCVFNLDSGEENGIPFLVTELCSRGDMWNVLQHHGIKWAQWFVAI